MALSVPLWLGTAVALTLCQSPAPETGQGLKVSPEKAELFARRGRKATGHHGYTQCAVTGSDSRAAESEQDLGSITVAEELDYDAKNCRRFAIQSARDFDAS